MTYRFRAAERVLFVLGAVILSVAIGCARVTADGDRPAVLVLAPQGTKAGWIDLTYLEELHRAGFEVDYTDSLSEMTWNRIKQYNVLVVYSCPPAPGQQAYPFGSSQTIAKDDFIELIDRFLGQGGGVLLMAIETNVGVTLVRDMIQPWGADLPLETISDPTNTALMSRMPKVPLAYTSAVASSPVSDGVRGIWYPTQLHYNGADTLPLSVDGNWQIVVRAMPSARTIPVDLSKSSRPGPPDPLIRRGGVAAPPLYAIRPYRKGRIAMLSQWPIYSIGSGTKWLYDREVLSKGLQNKPSDFGRLLENSFRWLAAPSLKSEAVGGYVTPAGRLDAPNHTAAVRKQFEEKPVTTDGGPSGESAERPLFKGLIGAQTSLSGGRGTVAEYAAAARDAGLDFVVFLEDFAKLDQDELKRLKDDCRRLSDGTLVLFPGYRIDTNIGNHMFLFGNGVTLPPKRLLTGPENKRFMLQGETAPGVFGKTPPTAMEFLFRLTSNTQIGYYDFKHSGKGMRLPDARVYSMVALRTYRNGTLVEDVTDDYLTMVQATIAAAPAAVHLVDSPSALRNAAQANQGITYAAARDRAHLWADALLYTNQYTCPNVFTSTGPLIQRWPTCERVSTYGAEPFVIGRSRREAAIDVTSARGLRQVSIYDGENLFRRFALNGEKRFTHTFYLDASVQRNLVLIAEDTGGGRAVSSPRRSWKDGSLAPVFCSDRINDCAYMFLARGPYPMTVLRTPELSDAGFTWDGGPRGILSPIDFEGSTPLIETDRGEIDGSRYNQTPLLEVADEGAVRVRSVRDELIDPRVPSVNPWNTYGPRADASLVDFSLSYTQFDRASVDARPVGWAAQPSQTGCTAALFQGAIAFKQSVSVRSLRLLHNWNWIDAVDLRLAIGRRTRLVDDVALAPIRSGDAAAASFRVGRGDWFGFYSPQAGNSQLFLNRGRPLELRVESSQDGNWLSLWAVGISTAPAGSVYKYDLYGVSCPLDAAVHDADTFPRMVRYLSRPDGLKVERGRRLKSPGLVQLRAKTEGAVRLTVPQPPHLTHLTLPVVVGDLNPRWGVGMWQRQGYVNGKYGPGNDRYREVGVGIQGIAYVPLYPDLADETDVEIGHPIVADFRGSQLFIHVTALSGGTDVNPEYAWRVDVNNPTDADITTVLTRNMNLPGLGFTSQDIRLEPGESRVVYESDPVRKTQ